MLANTLLRPWPKGEKLIADALEISPESIWPSSYVGRRSKSLEIVNKGLE